ncbi:bifunctional diaminohydroxyphosphoribosylaminopyrimidine deaminase/5-amino-6-(5-phosphoribosylamino)uracil reductase RibD [Amylibacter sp. SFDW26]|nr:bifunctional diaminohydroxyphosphoribosylaminopyrimidine deaminase/5-amino-6-(5-phosphoribosylamino)uracil reductase RibD [Amylibacter sp. SFDW26]
MRLALSLGSRGLGTTWPNPAVGCVIVKDGRVLGRGWTQPTGRPHAERVALAQAGDAAKGATAYVSLEPCSHTGKTSPCADALVDAGIARVVCATGDPDERVAGKGFDKLRAAGVEVVNGILQAEADAANMGFFTRITKKRPMITLKLASSLDSKIATKTGESQWITGPEARSYVHYLRATHDAVMVGSGTSIADDPSLTVRLSGLEHRHPVRIILDSTLSTPNDSALARTAHETPVWICHGQDADLKGWDSTDAKLIPCDLDNGHVSLTDALEKIAAQGITRVFCEGGGKLAASLMAGGFVDRLITMTAGIAIGADGVPNLGELGVQTLDAVPRFEMHSYRKIGDDLMVEWHAV